MRAIYRVQLTPCFGFVAVRGIVGYLHRLGISHLYLSPIFRSRSGSEHGYDITDYAQVNPELGGEPAFHALVAECRAHSMGLVLDIVPNHMAVMTRDNAWWLDVLENGSASRYARYFDIDWQPNRASMRNRLLVPALGSPLGEVLRERGISLVFDALAGTFAARYQALEFPLDPGSYPRILEILALVGAQESPLADTTRAQLATLLQSFTSIPAPESGTCEARLLRSQQLRQYRKSLALLCEAQPAVTTFIHHALQELQQLPPERSGELLASLLAIQPYRLAFWRVSGEEINYRRFFDVNDLAALRVERREVFDATHALLSRLWQCGCIDGVRVDHADGLYRPTQYFQRLRNLLAIDPAGRKPWIVAEKILGSGEALPPEWEIDGTTGYDFAALVTAWLMNDTGAVALGKIHERVTRQTSPYAEIAYQSRKQVMRTSLAAEISGLATRLDRLAQLHLDTSDFTLFDLREAVVEVLACFPVYRTYISDQHVGSEDARHIRRAVGVAMGRKQTARRALLLLERVLLGELAEPPAYRRAALEFTLRFQQVSGPVMAKGIEDTAYYRYPSLLAMNEVGGDPQCHGISTETLHQANSTRQRDYPESVLATSTHDTKRGEDARYRLCALTEITATWSGCLRRWRRLKGPRHGAQPVGATQEYLLLQSLLAIWPVEPAADHVDTLRTRMESYAIKSAREAKQHTSWLDPDADYEAALGSYVALLLPASGRAGFARYFQAAIDQASFFGALNALSATVLKFSAPGIPDIYQGNELPAFVLVDPDNRRQPDFSAHQRRLDELVLADKAVPANASALQEHWRDGQLKLFITWRLLNLRREQPAVFESGAYLPVAIEGTRAVHLCAYARIAHGCALIVVISRWAATLSAGSLVAPLGIEAWADTRLMLPTELPGGEYIDVLAGRTLHIATSAGQRPLPVATLLETLPVSVLVSAAQAPSSNSSNERPVTA